MKIFCFFELFLMISKILIVDEPVTSKNKLVNQCSISRDLDQQNYIFHLV